MRFYSCYYGRIAYNKMYPNDNTACWAGLRSDSIKTKFVKPDKSLDYTDRKKVFKTIPKYIYISRYISDNMPKNYTKLLEIINTMTTCVEYEFEGTQYIKYKLITNGTYYNNLVLLNFIRMIWYKPSCLDHALFFDSLNEYDGEKDGLLFLLQTIKPCIEKKDNDYGYGNHSLVYKGIIPKTFKELKAYKSNIGYSEYDMHHFLVSTSEQLRELEF